MVFLNKIISGDISENLFGNSEEMEGKQSDWCFCMMKANKNKGLERDEILM